MDEQPTMNFVTIDSQITTVVTNDYLFAYQLPLSRPVERLIDPAVESEGRLPYLPSQRQVAEAVFERLDPSQFRISSTHSSYSRYENHGS